MSERATRHAAGTRSRARDNGTKRSWVVIRGHSLTTPRSSTLDRAPTGSAHGCWRCRISLPAEPIAPSPLPSGPRRQPVGIARHALCGKANSRGGRIRLAGPWLGSDDEAVAGRLELGVAL